MFLEGHDEVWGFEYMWDPLMDFIDGRMHNLYYYNLAYEKPLYLHIDLARDNDNAAVFWYAASTVRHLGVGNYGALSTRRKAQARRNVSIYKRYQRYFSNGAFSGPDHLTHIHSLKGKGAVIVRFNDTECPVRGSFDISASSVGLSAPPRILRTLHGQKGIVSGSGDKI